MSDSTQKLSTPDWSSSLSENVYEPAEDSFLLLDAIEADIEFITEKLRPSVMLEIGSGSGIIVTALSKLLGSNSFSFAVDINWDACKATLDTAKINKTCVEMVCMDLVSGLRLNKQIDLLVFNPPYVVTLDEDVQTGGITASWAGGRNGRLVLDRLFEKLPVLLSSKSAGYFVVIEENKPEVIKSKLSDVGFTAEVIAKRKAGCETLSIIRFQPKH